MLVAKGLRKRYKQREVVKDFGLTLDAGEVVGLLGPNGAGKTTCFNLLTKFLIPTAGTIRYKDRDITGLKAADVARLGLVRSFQISAVFPHLTVMENVRIALQRRRRGDSFDFWRAERVLRALNGEALALVEAVGLSDFADVLAVELSYGRKRALEIATTLALDPEMLLLDEPMAGMGPDESARMVTLIESLRSEMAILLIEHDMDAVFRLANRLTVLVQGKVLMSGTADEVRGHPDVQAVYLGTEAEGHS